jgi:hypothetical protein
VAGVHAGAAGCMLAVTALYCSPSPGPGAGLMRSAKSSASIRGRMLKVTKVSYVAVDRYVPYQPPRRQQDGCSLHMRLY